MSRLWVLGPESPEMTDVEKLLRERGEQVVHAMANSDCTLRVVPEDAFRAICHDGTADQEDDADAVYFVECGWSDAPFYECDRIVQTSWIKHLIAEGES